MNPIDYPYLFFVFSLVALWLSALLGVFIGNKVRPLKEQEREDFGAVQTAILTLLGLLIGFAFSMAVNRYDQRKNGEEAEANAIGTEYIRADLLSSADAERVRDLLKKYLDQRILFYVADDEGHLSQINTSTAQLQTELWSTVQNRAAAVPTPVVALAVSGMNDVLNSQGYAQSAWSNRIPVLAWILLGMIAIGCNLVVGYGMHQKGWFLTGILPLTVSISFFLIADIDSPRRGTIRVQPQNLMSFSRSLPPH